MNVSSIGHILLSMVLPAIWVSIGPIVTTAITATVNTVMHTYVPRPVQLILASIIGAVVAGTTGDVQGIDPTVAAEIGGAGGLGLETALMLNSNRFLAGQPSTSKTS